MSLKNRNFLKLLDYTPAEMYKFDDSFVNVNGDTVSYAVCANNELAKNIFG